jgi:hypothetical protein
MYFLPKMRKNPQKNIKFAFQSHFNMEIMLNGWIDFFIFENEVYDAKYKFFLYFTTNYNSYEI